MNGEKVKKFKFLALWSDHKIEQWLEQMARQGLHLHSVNVFSRYTFIRGEPADVSYGLDFVPKLDRKGEYYGLFIDAGWEHVVEFTGWQYWRKPFVNGKPAEIFTDVESKIKKFKKALALLAICQLPLYFALVNPSIFNATQGLQTESKIVFFSIVVAELTTCFYFMGKLLLRIRQLKRDRK